MTKVFVRRPSWQRLRPTLRCLRHSSLLRCLEYECLAALQLKGTLLDFGGGAHTNNSEWLDEWTRIQQAVTYQSCNIDPRTKPTYLIEADGKIPVQDSDFDIVISLNTLEHVRDLPHALSEIRRVLRPGGRLVLMVPFMFRVHGHPDDYHRGTASFWSEMLGNYGFCSIRHEALVWGPFSTGAFVSGLPGPFKPLRRTIALLLDLAIARRRGLKDGQPHEQDGPVCNSPLGYFIDAAADPNFRRPEAS